MRPDGPRPRVALALAIATSGLAVAAVPVSDGGVMGAPPPGAPCQTVTVRVTGFRSEDGVLECSLFASPAGFPTRAETAIAQRRSPISPDLTATCVFADLAPGEYAVGVMHDENGNGKFDQGLFGVPLEGYGFSNNHTHAFSAPTWEESRFRVAPGESPTFDVQLRY